MPFHVIFPSCLLIAGSFLGYFVMAWVGAAWVIMSYLLIPRARRLMQDSSAKGLESMSSFSIFSLMWLTGGLSVIAILSFSPFRMNILAAVLSTISGQLLAQNFFFANALINRPKGRIS